MADLDEISLTLGEIRSDVKHALAWQRAHEIADQERFEALQARMDQSASFGGRLDAVELLAADHEPVIVSVRRFKWMVAGVAGVVSLVVTWVSNLWGVVSAWIW